MGNKEVRNANGELHNENGPALVIKGRGFLGLRTQEEKWCLNGQLHRENGPAHTEYVEGFAKFSKGLEYFTIHFGKTIKKYYSNGKLHAEDGPAVIIQLDWLKEEKMTFSGDKYVRKRTYDRCKPSIFKLYYENGQLHKTDGPAMDGYIDVSDFYNEVDRVKKYFLHGQEYTYAEYADIITLPRRQQESLKRSEELERKNRQEELQLQASDKKEEKAADKKEDKKENIKEEIKSHCSICMGQPRQILFVPCGHVVACIGCSEQVQICPICRGEITNRIRAYIT